MSARILAATVRRNVASARTHTPHTQSRFSSSASASSRSRNNTSSRIIRTLATSTTLAVTFYSIGSLYPPDVATLISPRTAPPPPHPTSAEAAAYTQKLQAELESLPLLNAHRSRPDAAEWYETYPFANLPEERRVNSLTAGALRGPGKLAILPVVRARRDESEAWAFVHVGRGLCGHDGIIHGGMLATLLDEALGRIAIVNLPEKIGVTAYLNLTYKAPTRADQFIVIKTRVKEVNGRKAYVEGRIEDMQGTTLVEANALFIQPKYAKLLRTSQVREMLGEPPKDPPAPQSVPISSSESGIVIPDGKSS